MEEECIQERRTKDSILEKTMRKMIVKKKCQSGFNKMFVFAFGYSILLRNMSDV